MISDATPVELATKLYLTSTKSLLNSFLLCINQNSIGKMPKVVVVLPTKYDDALSRECYHYRTTSSAQIFDGKRPPHCLH